MFSRLVLLVAVVGVIFAAPLGVIELKGRIQIDTNKTFVDPVKGTEVEFFTNVDGEHIFYGKTYTDARGAFTIDLKPMAKYTAYYHVNGQSHMVDYDYSDVNVPLGSRERRTTAVPVPDTIASASNWVVYLIWNSARHSGVSDFDLFVLPPYTCTDTVFGSKTEVNTAADCIDPNNGNRRVSFDGGSTTVSGASGDIDVDATSSSSPAAVERVVITEPGTGTYILGSYDNSASNAFKEMVVSTTNDIRLFVYRLNNNAITLRATIAAGTGFPSCSGSTCPRYWHSLKLALTAPVGNTGSGSVYHRNGNYKCTPYCTSGSTSALNWEGQSQCSGYSETTCGSWTSV